MLTTDSKDKTINITERKNKICLLYLLCKERLYNYKEMQATKSIDHM